MARVNIGDVTPGMVLASDVVGVNGRLLLTKGLELDEKRIRILHVWGVPDVDISGVDKDAVVQATRAGIDPAVLEACERHVGALFSRGSEDSLFLTELRRVAVERFARKVRDGAPMPKPPRRAFAAPPPSAPAVPSLQALVAKGQKTFAFPVVYHRIQEVLADPYCSVGTLAGIVDKDPGLSAKLLRIVNSPAYGFSKRVDTISQGISILGFKELTQLVLSVSVLSMFRGVPSDVLNVREFWKHSLSCGIFARALAAKRPSLSEERFFIAGLLHDLGRMTMLTCMGGLLGQCIEEAHALGAPLCEVERRHFGYSHAEVCGELLRGWKLPPPLVDMINWHHDPDRAPDAVEASVLCLADSMATVLQFGSSGNATATLVTNPTWERLDLPLSIIGTVVSQAERQIEETLSAFLD